MGERKVSQLPHISTWQCYNVSMAPGLARPTRGRRRRSRDRGGRADGNLENFDANEIERSLTLQFIIVLNRVARFGLFEAKKANLAFKKIGWPRNF